VVQAADSPASRKGQSREPQTLFLLFQSGSGTAQGRVTSTLNGFLLQRENYLSPTHYTRLVPIARTLTQLSRQPLQPVTAELRVGLAQGFVGFRQAGLKGLKDEGCAGWGDEAWQEDEIAGRGRRFGSRRNMHSGRTPSQELRR